MDELSAGSVDLRVWFGKGAAMATSRRMFLRGSAALGMSAALPGVVGCAPPPDPIGGPAPFRHGVASGDPESQSVVLWTRVDPTDTQAAATVRWEVATTGGFDHIVSAGSAAATQTRDWTVKVIADGLSPATTYFYRFVTDTATSTVGRTRTTPSGATDRVKLGVVSCSNYGYGNFYAYRNLAARTDLDAIVHLGDYIYEYAQAGSGETFGEFRPLDPPTEATTLDGYRRRYALYRRDADLRELHRQFPMIHLWDDHEFADDPFIGGAVNHQPGADGDWGTRVAAALQAYDEWMPTRVSGNQIYRTVDFGDLARLVLTDRQRRYIWPEPDDADLYLGHAQFGWLDQQLAESTSRWMILGAQTTFGSTDQDIASGGWGALDRQRVYDQLAAGGTDNLVVVSGDTHRALALDLIDDPTAYLKDGAGTAGVELSCGSISSPGSNLLNPGPGVRWNSGFDRTYLVLDIDADRTRSEIWGFFDFGKYLPWNPGEQLLAQFTTQTGANTLT